jgi:hypothetical protein
MIVEARQQLEAWITSVVGDVVCSAGAPGSDADADVVLYLLSVVPRTRTLHTRPPEPIPLALRYLVLTPGERAEERLDQLLEVALQQEAFAVDLAPQPAEVWLAFGVPPQPSFTIEMEVAVTRDRPLAPPVVRPLAVEVTSSVPLHGLVLGPGEVPIPGARVEVVGQGSVTFSDGRGQFVFPAVPGACSTKLRVSARGQEFLAVADRADIAEPVVITCHVLED